MEPRPHERGKKLNEYAKRPRRFSFNGATSSRTWKGRARVEPCSRGSRFNGATSSRTWKGGRDTTEPIAGSALQWSHVLTNVESWPRSDLSHQQNRGFNGATSSRTWKGVGTVTRGEKKTLRFNGATSSRTWKGRHVASVCFLFPRFNGATSSRTWKGPPATNRAVPLASSFNGATSSRTWKGASDVPGARVRCGLQWSHVLTNVERPERHADRRN